MFNFLFVVSVRHMGLEIDLLISRYRRRERSCNKIKW